MPIDKQATLERLNYAFLAALCDEHDANLYNEVFFPIIRYTIATRQSEILNPDGFSDLTALKDVIYRNFRVKIPSDVLRRSLKALQVKYQGMELQFYDKERYFKINVNWDSNFSAEVDELAAKFEGVSAELQDKFRDFKEASGFSCSHSLQDFLAAHAQDIFVYLEKSGESAKVDESFAGVAAFLKYLKSRDTDAFGVVNKFFWASVVSAFLRCQRCVEPGKGASQVEYYLDTPLLMALLGLSSIENEACANELLAIIVNAGHSPMFHSASMAEIGEILSAVAQRGGPKPKSPMAEAWWRRNLRPTDLLAMKVRLKRDLEGMGLIQGGDPDFDLSKTIRKFASNSDVRKLASLRNGTEEDPDGEITDFREIHDVVLYHWVKGCSGTAGKSARYFVSSNRQMVDLFRGRMGDPNVIHTSVLIYNLWLYGAGSDGLSQAGLTELMTRTISLNKSAAQSRLSSVLRHLPEFETAEEENETKKEIFSILVNRSQEALDKVEEIQYFDAQNNEAEAGRATAELIALVQQQSAIHATQIIGMKADLEDLSRKVESLSSSNLAWQQQSDELTDRLGSSNAAVKKANEARDLISTELNAVKQDNARLIEIADLKDKIKQKEEFIGNLETACQKGLKFFWWKAGVAVQCVSIVGLLGAIVLLLIGAINENKIDWYIWGTGVGIGVIINVITLISKCTIWKYKSRLQAKTSQAMNQWRGSDPHYISAARKLQSLKSRLHALESRGINSDHEL